MGIKFKCFIKGVFLILFSLIFISCSKYSIDNRISLANDLAIKNSLIKKDISSNKFVFRTYGKFEDINKVMKIYIEGDGLAWINRRTISSDPSPINPIALKFASKDTNPNIFYISRPCQYNLELNKNCDKKYWTNERFSIEVVDSFNEIIDSLKKEFNFKDIEIIGFSGGAAIATLVASKRDDIKKITTIVGNLNHKLLHQIHNLTQTPESLNPINIAEKISHISQVHYIGGKDEIITIDIVNSFIKASKNSKNIKTILIKEASHTQAWDNISIE